MPEFLFGFFKWTIYAVLASSSDIGQTLKLKRELITLDYIIFNLVVGMHSAQQIVTNFRQQVLLVQKRYIYKFQGTSVKEW